MASTKNVLRDQREAGGSRGRFEREEDDAVSFADYRLDGGRLIIEHVETPPAARGTGAAGRLMEAILARATAERRPILAECGYAAAWLRRHRGRP